MNIQEFISSGILESYLLGNATQEEREEVEKYCAICPEIKAEFEEMEKAMNNYAMEHSVTVPAYMKEIVIAKVKSRMQDSLTLEDIKVKSINKEVPVRSNFFYWSIAASFLFLVSAGFAIYFGVKSGNLNELTENMTKKNNALSDSIRNISSNILQMQNDLAILKDPMYKIVDLKGLNVSPDAKALVCWCPMDKKVFVEIDKLPPAPQGMQYELWAIVDGKSVSEGTLAMVNGLHQMKNVDNAQGFKITLEKTVGNESPNGDTYAIGTI